MAIKSEVNTFINTEGSKAINAIDKKYQQMWEDRMLEILEERGFAQKAIAIQPKINELFEEISKIENDMAHDEILGLSTFNMLARKLSGFIGEGIYLRELLREGDYKRTDIPLINEEYRNVSRETNTQYNNLRNAVKQMKADKAMEHLESLGFDITPLKNKTTETALLAMVDKTKLFFPWSSL